MKNGRKGKNAGTRQERRAHRRDNDVVFDQSREITRAPIKASRKEITPITDAQREYDAAMRSSRIVFGIGPAGTGKTWLASMRAAEALENKQIERIIVTRPVSTVDDEDLGFTPGDLDEKYSHYLLPVREALEERFGTGHFEYLMRKGIVKAIPMGFMRGMTIKNCWVIADEMQNASRNQFKMLLSRIGDNGKILINGDPTQLDIPRDRTGLVDAVRRLEHIKDVTTVQFYIEDIVRSGLCREIVEAYETHGS